MESGRYLENVGDNFEIITINNKFGPPVLVMIFL